MNTNELIGSLPETMQGNVSHSETAVTITLEKGSIKLDKAERGWGDTELTWDGKAFDKKKLEEVLAGKVTLKVYTPPPPEPVKETDLLAEIASLKSRVNQLESK